MLEKADREKRQKELMNIPKEIFMPAWQRQQEKNEVQLELERAFEKIYADSSKYIISKLSEWQDFFTVKDKKD